MTAPSETQPPIQFATGTHFSWCWLSTDGHSIDELLAVCPTAVIGKYLVVTSCDSGPLLLTDAQKSCGWVFVGGIAYSPRIESLDMLPGHGLYDEWYVFNAPVHLGAIREGNILDFPVSPRHLEVFGSFYGFAMDAPEVEELAVRFWGQQEWIHADAYIAESDCGYLTFVTANRDVFATVCKGLAASSGLPKAR